MEKWKQNMSEQDISMLSPLTLAFIGDSIYETMVRTKIIQQYNNLPAAKLHNLAVKKVKAFSQARAYDYIWEYLTDKEKEIMKRGRNNNSTHCPKNSNPIDYRKATGLECLFGYWYLKGENSKIIEFSKKIFDFLEKQD